MSNLDVEENHDPHHHGPHWSGDHNDNWIKQDNNVIHISAKAMKIIWGNESQFWQWVELPKEESCFEVGAELIQVNYLKVTGSLDLAKLKHTHSETYEILYILKFKADAFGWHSSPITFEVITPDGHKMKTIEILESHRRSNAILEVHGGHFTLSSNMRGKVEFKMCEVETTWWKGGLILEGVKVRPKSA